MVDKKSLTNIDEKWLPLVKKNCPKGFFAIIGFKLELYNDDEFIKQKNLDREELRGLIDSFKDKHKELPYFEVSSQERINMIETLTKCVELTVKHLKKKKMLTSFMEK